MRIYTKNTYYNVLTDNYIYQNYHKHSIYTNVIMLDAVAYPEDYAKRAVELGHGIISSCEHGYQGRYIESYQMAEKYNLKYLFAVEAYMVKDRFEKDKTNAHIVLAAKNENGRKAINGILSEANLTGFYYRARIDLPLLLSLPKDDVWVTSACIGGINRYSDYEDIVREIHNYFGDNFYLEVQAHNVEKQKQWNNEILRLSRKYNIEIIAGVDSHYIYQEDSWMRDHLQKSGHIFFEEEEGFDMDYPDGKTLFERFQKQGILNDDEIRIALSNTNVLLEVEEYTSPIFDHTVKMPCALKYQHLTETEREKELAKIVFSRWNEEKSKIPQEQWKYYEQEICKELKTIFEIKHADYFLMNYEIIKNAVENKNGMITFSGRGSGPSFIVNKLLGFTAIDRISCPITLYPERFLSASRIKAGSLADIDFNCGNVPAFVESQREIVGEEHAYPMLAYGKLKAKSAWKMYCRANDVDFDVSNRISSQIEDFEKDLKYFDPESGDEEPQVLDYIDEDLRDTFLQSKKFLGIIDHFSPHPCAHLILPYDIKTEVGIIRIKSKGGKETICTVMDGLWAEKFLMLKNDLLSVAVVKLIYRLYERTGIKYMDLTELMQSCKEHPEVWDIYSNGYTIGVNQLEKNSSKHKAISYKPHNISELSALIAGIRPAFKSLIDKLINRENFSYNIPTLDNLLQTEELPQSFILYQEQIMKVLAFAGIPMDDCYTVIKSISKKRFEVIQSYKETFINGFSQALQDQENKTREQGVELANIIWGIIEDASAYGFNSSHSLSVSFDSLLGAYFKALYPLEFYEVFLNLQMERADKAKALLAKKEAKKGFNIEILPMRFGQDNRKFTAYPEQNALSNCLKSIKGFGDIVGEELYKIADKKYESFVDFLIDKKESKLKINGTQMEILIRLNYFQEFGHNQALLNIFNLYEKYADKKILKKGKIDPDIDMGIIEKYIIKETEKQYTIDFLSYVKEIAKLEIMSNDKDIPIGQQLNWETELLEVPVFTSNTLPSTWEYVLVFKDYNDAEGNPNGRPYILTYNIATGNITKSQINKKKLFNSKPFKQYSIIDIPCFDTVFKRKQEGEKWVVTNESKTIVKNYDVILYEDTSVKNNEEE